MEIYYNSSNVLNLGFNLHIDIALQVKFLVS